ncbi:hypothetical protein AGMMS50256_07170 [Betaproteobacteria bacterium]|nr:hypothetical protein AGMMS50256_07170 [Betaproteobacteria bacterium]
MLKRCFEMKFLTPAFLGDAEQKGVWRTPPIKALLRQWWRVAYAARRGFDVAAMREAEGILFGHADGNTANGRAAARRSEIRLRLDNWNQGSLTDWANAKPQGTSMPKIKHPEVAAPVGSDLYLGFGPLEYRQGGTKLKKNAALQAGESAKLSLAWPDKDDALIRHALWLMDRFGTLGGRSRNGWGSFTLKPQDGEALQGKLPLRDWKECLMLDWPHAIGKDNNDNNALIWQTTPFDDWRQAMTALAKLKIELRTQRPQFSFTTGKNAPRTEGRHWLSYPVTNHSVAAWGNNLRLPNSLRFKLRQKPDGKLVGVIFHVPCLPPAQFQPEKEKQAIEKVWEDVHQFLDKPEQSLTRIPE